MHELFQIAQQELVVKNFVPTGGLNRWSNPANWDPNGVPISGDRLQIFSTGSSLQDLATGSVVDSIRVDGGHIVNGANPGLTTAVEFAIGIYNTGMYKFGTGTLNIQNGYIGASATGTFEQGSGRVNAGAFLSIGDAEQANGKLFVGGGTLSAGELDVGYFGDGSLQLVGGTVYAGGTMYAGFGLQSIGVVEQEIGTLVTGVEFIGYSGIGIFVQTGGSHTNINFMGVGETNSQQSSYYITNGTLTTPQLSLGYAGGNGYFNQSGGNVNAQYFYVGPNSNGEISGGLTTFGTLEVDGSLNIKDRTINISNVNYIARDALAGRLYSDSGVIGFSNSIVKSTVLGDATLDRSTDLNDFTVLSGNFGENGIWSDGDFNYNGSVDLDDFSILASNFGRIYGTKTSIPEPILYNSLLLLVMFVRKRARRNV